MDKDNCCYKQVVQHFKKMGKLSAEQIRIYLDEHLPYRSRVLIAHREICNKGPYHGEKSVLQACFEASLIAGRMYLNFLGISKNKHDELIKNNFRSDDISVEDLNGDLVDFNELTSEDKQLIIGFLKMADKGAAHLTIPMYHPWDRTHEAIGLILLLLQSNLYEKINEEIKY